MRQAFVILCFVLFLYRATAGQIIEFCKSSAQCLKRVGKCVFYDVLAAQPNIALSPCRRVKAGAGTQDLTKIAISLRQPDRPYCQVWHELLLPCIVGNYQDGVMCQHHATEEPESRGFRSLPPVPVDPSRPPNPGERETSSLGSCMAAASLVSLPLRNQFVHVNIKHASTNSKFNLVQILKKKVHLYSMVLNG